MHSDIPGACRVLIENVAPAVEHGRFPVKRTPGDTVAVEADIFTDGHDLLQAVVCYRPRAQATWTEVPMAALGNDRWCGSFVVTQLGYYVFTVIAWLDHFASWYQALGKRLTAGQDVTVELLIGADLVAAACQRATGPDVALLREWAHLLRTAGSTATATAQRLLQDPIVPQLMARYPDRQLATTYDTEFPVLVDPERARFSAWYEMFPRSCSPTPGQHGTLKDCEARLPYIASMGFDVLYLPPIHPIGSTHRKGKNNSTVAEPGDVGSPWAIGGAAGGHTAVHPDLGTLEDLRHLVARAREYGIAVALDIAFQCSPDHPYVQEHPEWFRQRPDGSVQYAENPPKKYEDIYPFDFETPHWQSLWDELKRVVLFWVEQGIEVFRVDNPHTKPLRFWEWLIAEVKAQHPQVIFLSEAFTRPKVRYSLAKRGFTQSYTYFAWRNTKEELTRYMTELLRTDVREFFGANLWPNTPDILPEFLQHGGRPAFMARLVLAATLSANYGIYGPAFELGEHVAVREGSEEYLDSEKYQLRHWNLEHPDSLHDFIARVNHVRHTNPALQRNDTLYFHPAEHPELLCYSKRTPDYSNIVLVVVNLNPYHTHAGMLNLHLHELQLDPERPYQAHDELGGGRYLWHGAHNYVELNPRVSPAHIFRLRKRVHREHDFEYFM